MTTKAGPSPFRSPAFGRYFSAVSVSAFGTSLTAVAMPVLVIELLHADAFEVGLVNAAQLLPYALLAGVYVDRWRKQRVLVWASLGRAVALATIVVLWFAGALQLWVLLVLLLAFGAFSGFGFAATQSLLPHVVERRALLVANARLDQAEAAAQSGRRLRGRLPHRDVLAAPAGTRAVTFVVVIHDDDERRAAPPERT
ncbi:MFS transporter [Salana multivorans]